MKTALKKIITTIVCLCNLVGIVLLIIGIVKTFGLGSLFVSHKTVETLYWLGLCDPLVGIGGITMIISFIILIVFDPSILKNNKR